MVLLALLLAAQASKTVAVAMEEIPLELDLVVDPWGLLALAQDPLYSLLSGLQVDNSQRAVASHYSAADLVADCCSNSD